MIRNAVRRKLAQMIVDKTEVCDIAKQAFDDIYPDKKDKSATLQEFEIITEEYEDLIRMEIRDYVDEVDFIGTKEVEHINREKGYITTMHNAYDYLVTHFESILNSSLAVEENVFEMFEDIL